jgi:hypothetical protein
LLQFELVLQAPKKRRSRAVDMEAHQERIGMTAPTGP